MADGRPALSSDVPDLDWLERHQTLHTLWCAAVDAATSPDFRDPPHGRCPECDGPAGELNENAYLRIQRRSIEEANAAIRREERRRIAADLRATFVPDARIPGWACPGRAPRASAIAEWAARIAEGDTERGDVR